MDMKLVAKIAMKNVVNATVKVRNAQPALILLIIWLKKLENVYKTAHTENTIMKEMVVR